MIRRPVRLALLLAACAAAACHGGTASAPEHAADPRSPSRGSVSASIRAEPRSFNAYVTRDLTSQVVSFLTQASLVRINRVTQELEPELAERWMPLEDGVSCRLTLRQGLQFSDGEPFSSADVVFSFAAIYTEGAAPGIVDSLRPYGKNLIVTAEGPHDVVIRFPKPFGPGLRLLDGVPMLPRDRLEAAVKAGTFRST